MRKTDREITKLIKKASAEARKEMVASHNEPVSASRVKWPVQCTVGPGLEGAIACESKVGFVNGSAGSLIYYGYDVFDLCIHSTFEEVCYLLLYGRLPTDAQLQSFNDKLSEYRFVPNTLRMMMSIPIEDMYAMSSLRTGVGFMRRRLTWRDSESGRPDIADAIASDEDSIAMETKPMGEERAIYEFPHRKIERPEDARPIADDSASIPSCMRLIAGMCSIAAGIARIRAGQLPIEPDVKLGHAANLLYMMTGKKPTPVEERVMDICLILHADHGMNASTFATMVAASTLADIYYSVGAGIAALSGPLHGGANEQVLFALEEIGAPENVDEWVDKALRRKARIPGFGHRVYKAYDPRARVLGPLASFLIEDQQDQQLTRLFKTASKLEKAVVSTLSEDKKIFPNVDFYSGLVYRAMGVPVEMFTPLFAVSRVAGWTARVLEYLKTNRIFRPRAMYIGEFDKKYVPIMKR